MLGIVFYVMVALLGLLDPFFVSLGIVKGLQDLHNSVNTILTTPVKQWLMDNMSILYWFIPKNFLWPIIVASFIMLALRIGLSIWHTVKW